MFRSNIRKFLNQIMLISWQEMKLLFLIHDTKPTQYKALFRTYLFYNVTLNSYNRSQEDALFRNLILIHNSTCFGQTYCPSSGSWYCIHSNWYLSCWLCWIGRPETRWEDDVSVDIKSINIGNWKKGAQSRESWKKVVEQAGTLYRL